MKVAKNILVLTWWDFESALITTYTLPYLIIILKQLPAGSKIFLLTISNHKQFRSAETRDAITDLEQKGVHVLNYKYDRFGLKMIFRLMKMFLQLIIISKSSKIDFLHCWCTPAGGFGYLLSLFTGLPLVLDSFEPHAETMVEGGTWKKNGVAHRLLFYLEKKQLQRASEVICAAPGMAEHAEKVYGISKPRYFIKPACVDLDLFSPAENIKSVNISARKITCVYAGKFGGIYLTNEVFQFFKVAFDHWHGNFKVLLLTGHSDQEISTYCKDANFPKDAIIKKFVSHNEVPYYMRQGDFGICPVKPLPSKKFCSPIKNGEYWAMGLPVIITKEISADSELVQKENIGYVLQDLTMREFKNAVAKVDLLLSEVNLKQRIRKIAERERNFSIAENVYRSIYAKNVNY